MVDTVQANGGREGWDKENLSPQISHIVAESTYWKRTPKTRTIATERRDKEQHYQVEKDKNKNKDSKQKDLQIVSCFPDNQLPESRNVITLVLRVGSVTDIVEPGSNSGLVFAFILALVYSEKARVCLYPMG